MFNKKTAFTIVTCLSASVSQAAITNVSVVNVPNSIPGYVTTDLFISFDGQYTGSQLYLEGLLPGQVYQDAVGSDIAPNPAFFTSFPDLAFDTFLAQGGPTSSDQVGGLARGGGAVSLGAPSTAQFDSDGINQAWTSGSGNIIEDRTDFMIARITLSEQANGSITYLASAGGEIIYPVQSKIINGSPRCFFCDYDGSGQVSGGDLDLVLLNWGDITPPIPAGWVHDLPVGQIGQAELDGVLLNWGNRLASAVPEPSTALLVLLSSISISITSRPTQTNR